VNRASRTLITLIAAAVIPPVAGVDSARGQTPVSPLSLIRGAEVSYGLAPFTFEQTAPDSTGDFSETGLELRLRLLLRLPSDRLTGIAEYSACGSAEGTEEIVTGGGVKSSTMEPDLGRFRVGLALGPSGGGALRFRAEAGYRWVRDEFTRRHFRQDGLGIGGAPDFVTERYHSRGFTLGAGLDVRLGDPDARGRAWRARAEGEFIPSLSTDVDNSQGASFTTDGAYWRGRAGLEWGTPSWGVALTGEVDRLKTDAAGPAASPAGPVRLGEGKFARSSLSLLLRLGPGIR
jgi:hypothetical protein